MSQKKVNGSLARRDFFKGAAAAGASLAIPGAIEAQTPGGASAAERPKVVPSGNADARETTPPSVQVITQNNCGADFMVDVLKYLGIEYVAGNTSSTLRALQESIVDYGGNSKPEFITTTHEEIAAAMGHGYYKIAHKPIGVTGHGSVGTMHATMGIYNAYCDRVPVFYMGGILADASTRNWASADWFHAAQDSGLIVRDFTKWDDQPVALQHFAESAVRAYRIAMTPPEGPVALFLDTDLQEMPMRPDPRRIPKLTLPVHPVGDPNAIREAAKLLVNAKNPMVVADLYARSQDAVDRLVEFAELLQVPVSSGGRMNFPTHHPLAQRPNIRDVDVLLCLNVQDVYGITHSYKDLIGSPQEDLAGPDLKVVSISCLYTPQRANFQDFQRFADIDLAIDGDAEATLPLLLEEVKKLMTDDIRRNAQVRGQKLAATKKAQMDGVLQQATWAWDASPISTARISMELYEAVRNDDWSFVVNGIGIPTGAWSQTKHYHSIGAMGGGGLGYGAPAAVGAALANKAHGRLSVAIIGDGDFMYNSAAMYTAAHHKIPLLVLIHNNRGYHQELMHIQRMASRLNRGLENAHIGCELRNPNIDYAKLASGLGVYSDGPIDNPHDLGPAIRRALAVVKKGEPALIDVVTQPR